MNKEYIIDEIVNNAIKLINIKTIKDNYKEFNVAYEIIKNELKTFKINEIVVNNYKNLVISNTTSKELDIIFCGHIDVVPSSKYEAKIVDGKLFGRGSFDMKSQLSVIVSLLKNNKTNKKFAFIITSDEEIGGMCCKKIMEQYDSNFAVIPDAGKNFQLIVEEKGLLQISINVHGIKSHASEPYNGENAILKAMKIYNNILKIYEPSETENDYKTSINLSRLNGGITNNSVPDNATMVLDIRFTNNINKDEILDNIKKVSFDSDISILDYGPTFFLDYNKPQIKEFIQNASNILNSNLVINRCSATSDAIYFSEKKIPTILINPIGDYWHTEKEYVNIESLYTLYNIFKTLL